MSSPGRTQVATVWGVLSLLFGLATHPAFGQADVGTLQVEIHDQQSGEIVPAMICITSLADNTWRCRPTGGCPRAMSPTRISSRGG